MVIVPLKDSVGVLEACYTVCLFEGHRHDDYSTKPVLPQTVLILAQRCRFARAVYKSFVVFLPRRYRFVYLHLSQITCLRDISWSWLTFCTSMTLTFSTATCTPRILYITISMQAFPRAWPISLRRFSIMSTSSSTPLNLKVSPLLRSLYPSTMEYQAKDFKRLDESPDTRFYSHSRFVQHIDDGAIASLKLYYGSLIKPHYSVVDLCSSWVSHLPDELKPKSMIGYGMNSSELSSNPVLTKTVVRDLNETPRLTEVEDASVDVVICSVSVDYLTKPVEVLGEVRRILKTGGTAHMAFSNRCFPTKVIGKWMGMSDEQRRHWVGGYFWACGGWRDVEQVVVKDKGGGLFGGGDPMYVVRATKE